MRVKQGWSGEVEPNRWAKIAVELDEDDLARMLREGDLHVSVGDVPLMTAYALLEAEAERMILCKLIVRHGYDQTQGTQEVAGFEQTRLDLLNQIRHNLTPAPDFAQP